MVDLKYLEQSLTPQSSPDLDSSFKEYLLQRKEKARTEKIKIMQEGGRYHESPVTSRTAVVTQCCLLNDTTIDLDNTMSRESMDSFMENERICENTVHLNNVSANLIDLTLDTTLGPKLELKKQIETEETFLNDVEAPSFLFNNTTIVSSNNKSPLAPIHANRPSTILEVSENSLTNKTGMSSYQTAFTRSVTETSEYYRTANEDSFMSSKNNTVENEHLIVKPKYRSFYSDMTKDSLDIPEKDLRACDMIKDSLNNESSVDSSIGGKSGDNTLDTSEEERIGRMNDTLEEIEFMLEQAKKIKDNNGLKTPNDLTPFVAKISPVVVKKPPKLEKLSNYLKPKVFGSSNTTKSPILMKALPVTSANKSPSTTPGSTFKRPMPAVISNTKIIPQPSSFNNNKRFNHIQSPVGRYIKHTPELPLEMQGRLNHGVPTKHFNFRDSESFSNENENLDMSLKCAHLPPRAKTKSTAIPCVSSGLCLIFPT